MIYRILATTALLLGGADALTTEWALSAGHIEANPLVAYLVTALGSYWLAPKMALHLLVAWFILFRRTRKTVINAGVVCVGYLAIVTSNAIIIIGG
jgi:hypothetical protein